MIITQVRGGLGNQMFQYAAGRALAVRKNTEFILDVSAYEANAMHQGFELQRVFISKEKIASSTDIKTLLGWKSPLLMRRILARPYFGLIRRNTFVVEPHFNYWPDINSASRDCYLQGYWQSEKYFDSIIPSIRENFKFILPMSEQNKSIAAKIGQVNSISLHVRRGDYANNPKTNATHGTCTLKYYREAILHIADTVENPHFFIFSDDMKWVRDNLELQFPYQYIDHNRGLENYNDMRLMSLCQHHIIANSSFSWWGAWLNKNQDKIVIAPKNWFLINSLTNDLYPEGWLKL